MNWREHPKFSFLKKEIEKYIKKGERLGTCFLSNPLDEEEKAGKIRRCLLGAVAFNYNIPITSNEEVYNELEGRFDLSYKIAIGFDQGVHFPNSLFSKINETDEVIIGQEIALFCVENNWINLNEA